MAEAGSREWLEKGNQREGRELRQGLGGELRGKP